MRCCVNDPSEEIKEQIELKINEFIKDNEDHKRQ